MPPEGPVTRCGSCASTALTGVLDFGRQPLPQAIPGKANPSYPLRLVQCARCTLVQLDYIVPQTEAFPPEYPYSTGNTAVLRNHFTAQAHTIAAMIPDGALVVDIGANDGTMLAALNKTWTRFDGTKYHPRVLAVEPTNQARKCEAAGVPVVQAYFTARLGAEIAERYGVADVVVTSNTFGHVPDPHDFLNGVNELLAPDGTFIVENQDWFNIVDDLQIDTIYHEHLRYYTPASLSWLLARHGFMMTSWNRTPMHGGAFRMFAVREKPDLGGRTNRLLVRLHQMVHDAAGEGDLYAVTAPTRATPLINASGIGTYLACACEVAGSDKIGATIPGTDIPVVDEQRLIDDQPPHALILAWDLADGLIPVLQDKGYKGRFIVPLPEPRIIGG